MNGDGEPGKSDVHGSPEGRNSAFGRFESFVRKVVTTPKPASAPVDAVGEPSDDGSDPERQD
jgi:hypothetical protein